MLHPLVLRMKQHEYTRQIPRSVTVTSTLGACPLAWASGDVLVATHTDESRSFRRDRHLEVDLSQIWYEGYSKGWLFIVS